MGDVSEELRKFLAPEYIYGLGARFKAGQYAQNFQSQKALVVSDPGVISAGWAADVLSSLEDENLPYEVFSELSSNPKSREVMNGADIYESAECDVIIAVGGGSVIDCAKGIGIVASNGGNVLDYEGVDMIDLPSPPLICIPTTAGTAADVSQFAIINNEIRKSKIAIISKVVVPDISLIDPETTLTMDLYLTACTGMDALTHAIEAFVSNASSPMTDLHALQAIRLISSNLENTILHPQNIEYRNNMMLGCLQSGLAFSNASLGAVHAMAHSLGGYLDLPHGECNSLLLDHVMRFNFTTSEDRFIQIGEQLNIPMKGLSSKQKSQAILTRIEQLKKSVGINWTLEKKGLHRTDIPTLSEFAIRDACIVTNPRDANQRDIEVIYEEAL